MTYTRRKTSKDDLKRVNLILAFSAGTVVLAVIASLVYVGYQNFQNKFEELNKQNLEYQQQLQQSVERAAEETEKTKQSLEEEKEKSAELAEDLDATKKASQQQISALQNRISTISAATPDSSLLVQEWASRVGFIYCLNSSKEWTGSGTAFRGLNGNVSVLTNFHVVLDADFCAVSFPGDTEGYYFVSDQNFIWDDSPYDWAYIIITNPSSYLYAKAASPSACSYSQLSIGDGIIVLGYPGDGAETVTVTQGIISGIKQEFWVSDAKIDHGNSGGAAIQSKNNCYIGIPTAAQIGQVESYAQILDGNLIF